MITIEEHFFEELDILLTIADERALSQKHSPFKTFDSLADYIEMLLKENQNSEGLQSNLNQS